MNNCYHGMTFPLDEEAESAILRNFTSQEIREYWPRFYGDCQECGYRGIAYVSYAHYIGGDW